MYRACGEGEVDSDDEEGRAPAGRAAGSGQLALSSVAPPQPSRYLGNASTTSITRWR